MFGRYNSFPARFGNRKASITKAFVDVFVDNLKFAYSEDEDSFSWAELYCVAKACEFILRYNGAVAKNAIPGKATYSLEDWERDFGLSVVNSRNEIERRNLLAAKWINDKNNMEALEIIAGKIFGSQFDDVYTDDEIQWWENNPNPEAGYDWVAGACHLVFYVSGSGSLSDDEFLRKCADLSVVLDAILPIYNTYSFSKGECFRCGVGKLGINPLCSG